jgi:hypothetical protein
MINDYEISQREKRLGRFESNNRSRRDNYEYEDNTQSSKPIEDQINTAKVIVVYT